MKPWTVADSAETYRLERWGCGYFSISPEGKLRVHPGTGPDQSIELEALVQRVQQRGLDLPILFRFNGILRDRLQQLHDCFQRAIDDHQYQGNYRCVFPIKVNQQRDVVQKIAQYGREFGFGLEAGSKPELLAVVAMADAQMPIVCNGFKDDEFIQMALFAQQIGRSSNGSSGWRVRSGSVPRSASASSWRPAAKVAGNRPAGIDRSSA
jgi:arginine decarboxylase